MQTNVTRRVRTAQADRMGWAWEKDELPDMTPAEAQKIIADYEAAAADGQISNEDPSTIAHARLLIEAAGSA